MATERNKNYKYSVATHKNIKTTLQQLRFSPSYNLSYTAITVNQYTASPRRNLRYTISSTVTR